MNEELHDRLEKPKGGFQFTEEHMELLRSGNGSVTQEIEIMMAMEIVRQVDSWLRAIRSKVGWRLCREDCLDIVMDFRAYKLQGLIEKYRNLPAQHFTALFYKSLKNYARDWLRKYGREDPVSNRAGAEGDEGGDRSMDSLPSESEDFSSLLTAEEMEDLLKDVREFILRWTDDPVQRWVLEKLIFEEMTAGEISAGVKKAFPGKVYATGSVYSLLSRFRSAPGLRRIKQKYLE